MTATPSPPRLGAAEWGLLLTLSVLWGGSFFFAKIAVAEVPPLTLVFFRVGIAALALHIVVRAGGLSMAVGWRIWAAFFAMGLLNNLVPFSLIFWGQQQIGAGLAAILNATTPLFTVLVAHWLTSDEKATGARLLGVVVGLAGVAAMMGPDAVAGLGGDLVAQVACIGAAISYAFAGIFGRRFKGLPPLVTACGQVSATTVMMLPLSLIVDRALELPLPSPGAIAAILALALVSTALAYVIFFRILKTAGATNLLLVTFLIPVSAILLGVAFLGEALLPRHLVGMAAIGIGLACIDGRLVKRFWPAPRTL
jgi:drug/metabolite transporter (DMT)-like permease